MRIITEEEIKQLKAAKKRQDLNVIYSRARQRAYRKLSRKHDREFQKIYTEEVTKERVLAGLN